MHSRFRPRLTFANVTSLLALFVALGGTGAYAVDKLDGDDIEKRSIPGDRLEKGGVQSKEVSNLLAKDFKEGQLPAGPTGPQGPTGATGPQGPPGPRFKVGTNDIEPGAVFGTVIRDSGILSEHIVDGTLKDIDLGRARRNVLVPVGVVPANGCKDIFLEGSSPGERKDHVLLTPRKFANVADPNNNAADNLSYNAFFTDQSAPQNDGLWIRACNPTAAPIDDANTVFNILQINTE